MSERDNHLILQYYAQHSTITDPRQYADLFDALPRDIPELMKTVQGLLVFPFANWAKHYGLQVSEERCTELRLRAIPKMVERILALDPAPLSVTRPPEKRLYGLCRDFAVLLVSMLRHQGVPTRERVGFAAYFDSDWYWDHRITEYWDASRQQWLLVDPRIDEVQRHILERKIDPLNITRESPFLTAGEVWQQCRAGQADPDLFVDSPTDRGMPMIRYALLHDFDALNKVELVGMDAWHELIDKPEEAVTEEDKKLLDEIADLTVQVDTRFDDLRALYAAVPYSQTVQKQLLAQA
jgi:excinuclease ABC subunit A